MAPSAYADGVSTSSRLDTQPRQKIAFAAKTKNGDETVARPWRIEFMTAHRLHALVLTASLLLSASPMLAAEYPTRSIKLVVPASAGSSADLGARVFAKRFSIILGQAVIIENKVGAGGRLGAGEAARAAADGYTLLYGTSITQALYPALVNSITYDPFRNFTALGQMFWFATMLVCNSEVPFTDLKGLIAFAKNNPDKLSFANSGVGGGNHFSNELFARMADIKVQHIPFRGNTPGIHAVVSNFVNCTSQTEVKSFVEAGQLRAFATTGKKRDPRFPDVPTLAEAGLSDAETTWWHAVYAPAGTPAQVVERLRSAVLEAARDPSLGDQTREVGLIQQYLEPDEVTQRTRNDIALFSKIAKESNISLD
jgi:tripartite-type tricarboxylate transporter receptor subunit TctC